MDDQTDQEIEQEKLLEFYLKTGISYFEEGAFPKATECYLKAIDICKDQKNDKILADIMLGVGKSFYRSGLINESRNYVEQALELFEKFSVFWGIAEALETLGDIECEEKRYDNALNLFKKSVHIRKKANLEQKNVNVCIKFGSVYLYLNNYELAYKSFSSAYEIYNFSQNTKEARNLIASIQTSLGICASKLLWHEKAIHHFLDALDIFDALQDLNHKSSVLNFLGKEYFEIQDYSKSLLYFLECLEIIEVNNLDKIYVAIECIFNIAEINISNEDFTKALEYNRKGLNLLNKNQNRLWHLHFLLQQSLCFFYLNEAEKGDLILSSQEFLDLINEYGTEEEKEIYNSLLTWALLIKERNIASK